MFFEDWNLGKNPGFCFGVFVFGWLNWLKNSGILLNKKFLEICTLFLLFWLRYTGYGFELWTLAISKELDFLLYLKVLDKISLDDKLLLIKRLIIFAE